MARPEENNDLLLLVNSSTEENRQSEDCVQSVMMDQGLQQSTPFEAQQFIVQSNHSGVPEDLQTIGDFLRNQSITLDGAELSVIERDGLQYIVLPSASVSHLLTDNNIVITHQADINPTAPEVYTTTQPTSADTTKSQSLHSQFVPVNTIQPDLSQTSTLQCTSSLNVQGNSIGISGTSDGQFTQITQVVSSTPATTPQPSIACTQPTSGSLESTQFQSFDAQYSTTLYRSGLDFSKIVPTLCQNGVLPGNLNQEPNSVHPKCVLCSFTAETEMELDDHMNAHRNEVTNLLYNNCKENFERKSPKRKSRKKKAKTCKYIRTTAPTLPKKGPFLCNVCNVEIPKINMFRKHLKDHMNEKTFKCDACPESYNLENNLILHKGLHADKGDNGYNCPACHRTFMRVASLKSHISLHFEDETMICTECGDEFMLKSELDLHMHQHQQDLQQHLFERNLPAASDGSDPNAITLNSKSLQDMSQRNFRVLKSKKRLRKRADPQQCHVCQKIFQKESQFKRHMLIHTGEKPFMCTHCGRCFNQKSALQIHMFKHSGQKPHKCPYCPQLYAQLGNLRMHVERVHSYGTNKFKCTACSCIFKRMGSLNAHITKYHQDDGVEKDVTSNEDLMSLITNEISTGDPACSLSTSSQNLPLESSSATTSLSDAPSSIQPTSTLEKKKSGKDDLDVIQQLLRSLDDDESNPDALDVATEGANLLNIDNDIVHRALMDSGLENTNSKKNSLKETNNDSNIQHVSTESNSDQIEDAPIDENIPTTKPRSSVISGLYMRTIGPSGEHTWKVRKCNGIRWHQCMYCTKEFKKPSDLVRHIRVHTQERPYKCQTCHKSFSVKTSLTTHARTHLGYKAFKCQICLKSFSTPGSLKIHLRVHTGSRPFKCNQCELSFRTASHRHNHILSHMRGTAHKRLRKPRKDVTQIILTSQQVALQEPILIRADGSIQRKDSSQNTEVEEVLPEHKCLLCSKRFKKSSHLRQHVRTHTGEKPYQCNQCGLSVSSASNLKTHMSVHTGLKAHQCTTCGQYFGSNNTLKRHMTTHSDARPYMCPYCQKTFKTNPTCKKHIATHKSEINEQPTQETPTEDGNSTNALDQQTLIELQSIEAQQEQYANQSSGMLTHDGISLNHQTIEINNDPVLEQIDPNIIQDFGRMATYKVNENGEETNPEDYVTTSLSSSLQNQLNDPENHIEHNYLVESTVGQNNPSTVITSTVAQHIGNFNENNVFEISMEKSKQNEDFQSIVASENGLPNNNDIVVIETHNTGLAVQQQNPVNEQEPSEFAVKCLGCLKIFETHDHLARHQKAALSNALSFQCDLCCHSLESKSSLLSHIESHTSSEVVPCQSCFITFDSNGVPDEHKLFHNPSEFGCKSCHKVFQSPSVLQIHNATSHNYTGPTRPKRKRTAKFYLLSDEQNEILKNTDPNQSMTLSERVLISAVADKDTVSLVQKESGRGRHKELELNGPVHPNVCQYCPKSFQKPSDLARHVRIHTGDKPFTCSRCGKSFSLKSTLVVHEKAHLQNKMFRCHICDIMYASKASLKVHMRLHTGAKPYKCSLCPMTFRASSHRKSHMATHMVMRTKAKDSLKTKTNSGDLHPSHNDEGKTTTENKSSSSPKPSTQPSVFWPDMGLTVPMESLLSGNLFQNETDSIPISINPSNMELVEEDGLRLQIDPLMQQNMDEQTTNKQVNEATISQSQQPLLSSCYNPTSSEATFVSSSSVYPCTTPTWPPPNVVIQPISNLCYQPLQNVGDSAVGLGDETRQQFQEINIAVPSSLAGITQQLLQSPLVVTLNNENNEKNQEFTVNLNNPAVIQAVQQALSNLATVRLQGQDENLNASDITLTINPQDISSQVVTNEVTISDDIGQTSTSAGPA